MANEEKLRLKHNLCQRKYKKKMIENDPDFKSKQNKMSESSRKNRISRMNTSQLKAYRSAAAERKRKSRENKKKKELESNEHLSETMDSTSSKDHSFGSYKKPQSLGKAVRKCAKNLPISPSKQKAVVMALAKKVGLEITNKKNISLSNSNNVELKEILKNFYYRPDISYQCAGMKESMCCWEKGKKITLRKFYLTMYLREAYAVFKDAYPDMKVSFTVFKDERPANVLLMKDTPSYQCLCKIHENFLLKLKGINMNYDSSFWNTVLCDSTNSNCWNGTCLNCKGGKNIPTNVDPTKNIQWQQWENVNNTLAKNFHKDTCSELMKKIKNDYPEFLKHVNIKRIQESEFVQDKSIPGRRILQCDFAMAYECEFQNEVQSALWSRKSVTLFTVAVFLNGECSTYLVCSDTQKKDKDVVSAILIKIYDILINVENKFEEVIWSDGPSSEFKNKFMCRFLVYLSKKYDRKFSWKYTATSHGKGVVDGIGGLAKSMVLKEVFSKHGEVVVQSPKDFFFVAKRLLSKTKVLFISNEEIEQTTENLNLWSSVPAVPGIRDIHHLEVIENGTELVGYFNSKQSEPCIKVSYADESQPDLHSLLSLEVGDWCLVKYDTESYAGTVTSVISNSGPYEVSVMHRSGHNWKWPDHPDKILYEANYILKRLTPPEVVNARGVFKFNDLL